MKKNNIKLLVKAFGVFTITCLFMLNTAVFTSGKSGKSSNLTLSSLITNAAADEWDPEIDPNTEANQTENYGQECGPDECSMMTTPAGAGQVLKGTWYHCKTSTDPSKKCKFYTCYKTCDAVIAWLQHGN